MPYVLHVGQFSQCGGKERVVSLEIYSPKEVVLETERGLKRHVQYFDNSLSWIDEKSLSVYLQNIALQVVGLSDGKFRLAHHVTGMGAGAGSSKPQKNSQAKPQVQTLSESKQLYLRNICIANNNDIDQAREILKHPRYTEESFYYSKYSSTASLLVCASEHGKLELIKLFLEKGANIESRHNFSYTNNNALIEAAEKGHLEVVKYLVESGAEVGVRNQYKWTATICAQVRNKNAVVRYLAPKVKDTSELDELLARQIWQNNLEFVELWLSYGADPKKVPAEAMQKASDPIRKLLVQKGEVAIKIANKVVRDLKIDHSFLQGQVDRFQPLLITALSDIDFMISLLDESKPENVATSQALAEGLVAQILRYQKNLASLSDSDIKEGFNEVLIRIKSHNFSSPPAQPLPAARSVPQANVSQPTVVYQQAAPVHRQTYQAPPPNLFAQDMQATAQMLNAFAAAENGAASFVNAIENNQ